MDFSDRQCSRAISLERRYSTARWLWAVWCPLLMQATKQFQWSDDFQTDFVFSTSSSFVRRRFHRFFLSRFAFVLRSILFSVFFFFQSLSFYLFSNVIAIWHKRIHARHMQQIPPPKLNSVTFSTIKAIIFFCYHCCRLPESGVAHNAYCPISRVRLHVARVSHTIFSFFCFKLSAFNGQYASISHHSSRTSKHRPIDAKEITGRHEECVKEKKM